jgi:uncharacterized delta-60 repeat protein
MFSKKRSQHAFSFFISLVSLFCLFLIVPQASFGLVLYEDFSSSTISAGKWQPYDFVREVQGGQARLKVRSTTASTGAVESGLWFQNPSAVNAIEAKVTPFAFNNPSGARGTIYIGGRFFNDGTGSPGTYTGDIFAQVAIGGTGTTPVVQWFVLRNTSATDPNQTEVIAGDTFSFTPVLGTQYTISIVWDGTDFIFDISGGSGGEQWSFEPELPVNPANMPIKLLATRLSSNAGREATVEGLFDDIKINGSPAVYDDFSAGTIDPTKWRTYESVREIQDQKLRLKMRTSTTDMNPATSAQVNFLAPEAISIIQAKITPISYSNPNGLNVRAGIFGEYYNDGTLNGWEGEISAVIAIGGTDGNLVAGWGMTRHTDPTDANQVITFATGNFTTPITLGTPYTLSIFWDGVKFIFKLNDEEAVYIPTTPIYPVLHPSRRLQNRTLSPGGQESMMEVIIDDVMVSSLDLTYYDDFSSPTINTSKWVQFYDYAREIQGEQLRSKLRSTVNTTGAVEGLVSFQNPETINSIETKATLLSFDNPSGTRAGAISIAGRFFNDGSATPGQYTGDILGQIVIGGAGSSPAAFWSVYRYIHPTDANQTELIDSGVFALPPIPGIQYTISVDWDGNQFTFRIGDGSTVEEAFSEPGLPVNPANMPVKSIGSRISSNAGREALVEGLFDDVKVNGSLYDDFSSGVINPTKWKLYEFVRDIENEELRLKIRTSTTDTSAMSTDQLVFPGPEVINIIQTKITPLAFSNPNGLNLRAGISGEYYNDGTLNGWEGEISAAVGIGGTDTNPVAAWSITRHIDQADPNLIDTFATGTFTTPIILGTTYTILLSWDGTKFTFKFNDEEATYTPAPPIHPAIHPARRLQNRVLSPSGLESVIEATYDDVIVAFALEEHTEDYALTANVAGSGTGTLNGQGLSCVNNTCSGRYPFSQVVAVTALPDPGSSFTSWSGCDAINGNVCTVAITSDQTVTAVFTAMPSGTLTVSTGGSGSGTVTGNGINCGSDCVESYTYGSVVALTATPGSGSAFTYWTGCDTFDWNSCTVTMNANKAVTAFFALGGTIDPEFPDTQNLIPVMYSIALQPDGKILIGGLGEWLARLNPNGSLDTDFNPDTNNMVYSMATQPDGKILIGGYFTTIDGGATATNHIARLNPNGSPDTDFNPDANSTVYSIALQPDGKILVGGAFDMIGGVSRDYIARLNTNGTVDGDFNYNVIDGWVYSIALQPDGKILIGGDFTMVGEEMRNHMARLNPDGTLDTDFNPDVNGIASSIALQPDGKILLGGFFTTVGGETRNRMARLNENGTLDTEFNPDVNGTVTSIVLQTDGKILIGGLFTTVGGETRNNVARLNSDGTVDMNLNPNADHNVDAIVIQADGKIILGGGFINVGGEEKPGLARLTNTEPAVQELSISSDGSLITWMRGQASPEVWRATFDHSTDGVNWTNLGNGVRINGGWQLTGFSLPTSQDHYIRARGYASGGYHNACNSLIESVKMFSLTSVVASDFNGDGNPDILWRNTTTGDNVIWLMNGTNWLNSVWLGSVSDTTWSIVGVGDFNNDTNPDILWRNTVTGDNVIWLMNGTNWLQSVWLGSVPDTTWSIVGVGDFNKDTYPDILWRNTTTGDNVIWLMNGTNWLQSVWLGSVPDVTWSIVGVGDFNHDSNPDILWRNTITGDNVIWLMNGTNWLNSIWLGSVSDTHWSIVGVGDFNHDSNPDILWRNSVTGDNVIWLMNGTNWLNSIWLPAVPDVTWAIVGQ